MRRPPLCDRRRQTFRPARCNRRCGVRLRKLSLNPPVGCSTKITATSRARHGQRHVDDVFGVGGQRAGGVEIFCRAPRCAPAGRRARFRCAPGCGRAVATARSVSCSYKLGIDLAGHRAGIDQLGRRSETCRRSSSRSETSRCRWRWRQTAAWRSRASAARPDDAPLRAPVGRWLRPADS